MEVPNDWNDQDRERFKVAWLKKETEVWRKRHHKTAKRQGYTLLEYAKRLRRQEVEAWKQRSATRTDLWARWNIVHSDQLPMEYDGEGLRCEVRVKGDACPYRCHQLLEGLLRRIIYTSREGNAVAMIDTLHTIHRAGLPEKAHCPFHLTVDLAGDLGALLKGDPEAITWDRGWDVSDPGREWNVSDGVMRLLIDERLKNGPTAEEAHRALQSICEGLMDWRPAGRSRRGRPGVSDFELTWVYAQQYVLAKAFRADLKQASSPIRNPSGRARLVRAVAEHYCCGKRREVAFKWLGMKPDGDPIPGASPLPPSDIAAIETSRILGILNPKSVSDRLSRPVRLGSQ